MASLGLHFTGAPGTSRFCASAFSSASSLHVRKMGAVLHGNMHRQGNTYTSF